MAISNIFQEEVFHEVLRVSSCSYFNRKMLLYTTYNAPNLS